MWHTDKQNKCSEQNTVIGRQCITESHWQVENDMHLLIISSASSTLKAMRSVSGTGTLPLQRDLLGIFVQRQVDRYMTGQRGHGNMARKVVSRKYRLSSFWMCEHQKDESFFNSQEITSYELKKPSGRDAHLAEQKLAVNSTARARKSRKRLFVPYQLIVDV